MFFKLAKAYFRYTICLVHDLQFLKKVSQGARFLVVSISVYLFAWIHTELISQSLDLAIQRSYTKMKLKDYNILLNKWNI